MESKPRRRIRDRVIGALLRPSTIKLGPFEFHGPALLIYPVEMMLIAVIIILIIRPEILTNIIDIIRQ
jgi:hypothetical protein